MNPSTHYALMILSMAGSIPLYLFVQRIFLPPPEVAATDVTRIAGKEVGVGTAFSTLNPKGALTDKIDLFLLKLLRLGPKLEELHMLLGRPAKPTPLDILHMKEIAVVALGAILWLMSHSLAASVILGPLGFLVPDALFKSQIKKRQAGIMRNFPTMVDLEALTIEAGLDYMTAFDRILKNAKQRTELEKELGVMLDEISLGYSRRDALRRLALRTGTQEIRSFVGLIIQSDELGTSLVDLLRNYASDMRFRRLNRAEKLAAQASTKMLIPLFLFIFPTVFIMLLSPMIKSLMKGGLGF